MERIELDTLADFLRHKHALDCWFPGSRRWATCDIAMLVQNGLGNKARPNAGLAAVCAGLAASGKSGGRWPTSLRAAMPRLSRSRVLTTSSRYGRGRLPVTPNEGP